MFFLGKLRTYRIYAVHRMDVLVRACLFLKKKKKNTREPPSVKLVKLGINHVVGLVPKHHIVNEMPLEA